MLLDISIRTTFDSHNKNAEVIVVIREGIDYSQAKVNYSTKVLFGGNFIICSAKDYDDVEVKTKALIEQLKEAIKPCNDPSLIIPIVQDRLKLYKKASE